jgi:hypothetical protein
MKIVRTRDGQVAPHPASFDDTVACHSRLLLAEIAEYAERSLHLDFASWLGPRPGLYVPSFEASPAFMGMSDDEGGAGHARPS